MAEGVLACLVVTILVSSIAPQLARAITRPTPGGAVLITSSLYIVGAAIVTLRDGSEFAAFVTLVSSLFFAIYLVGYLGFSSMLGLQTDAPGAHLRVNGSGSRPMLKWALFISAIGFCLAATYFTGAFRLIQAVLELALLGATDASILDLRLSLAGGEEKWIAPGYLKQVRDVVMPLSVLLLLFSIRRNTLHLMTLAIPVLAIGSLAMLSTGERAPVALFMLAILYAAFRAVSFHALSLRAVIVPLAVMSIAGMGAFYVLTSSFTSRNYGDSSMVTILLDRITTRTPEENIQSAVVWSQGAPFPGAGWLSDLASVLPGTQLALSNVIHEYLGGSDRGNSVLGMWTDVYYNFGGILGAVVAFYIGLLLALFNHWVNESRSKSLSADLCGLWISVCMLWVFSPFGFLLYGPFVLSACLWVIRHRSAASKRGRRDAREPAWPPTSPGLTALPE